MRFIHGTKEEKRRRLSRGAAGSSSSSSSSESGGDGNGDEEEEEFGGDEVFDVGAGSSSDESEYGEAHVTERIRKLLASSRRAARANAARTKQSGSNGHDALDPYDCVCDCKEDNITLEKLEKKHLAGSLLMSLPRCALTS